MPISVVKNASDVSNIDSSNAVMIFVVVAVTGPSAISNVPFATASSIPPASANASDDGDGIICVPRYGAGVFDATSPWNADGAGSPWIFNCTAVVVIADGFGLIIHVPVAKLCVATFVKFCGCRYGCTISVSVTLGFLVNIISDVLYRDGAHGIVRDHNVFGKLR